MANAKRDSQEKSGKSFASTKLSKEMKADIEKMMDKRLFSIEKQLEKLKGSDSKKINSKSNNSKDSDSKGKGRKTSGKTKATKVKQDSSTKGKKTGGRGKKKSNQRNEDAE